MEEYLFKDYKHRLNALDKDVRILVLKYAEEFYIQDKCTKAEAIDRAIAKAEMKKEIYNLTIDHYATDT